MNCNNGKDTHIFISLLGITWVSKRHLELQKSKSIIVSSPSSLTFGLHVTYISGWPPHFSMISHKYPLHSHCAKNFSSFIPEIVESLFNVPSFSPCHPFISVLLSHPFWNADSIVMCLCQKPFHEAFWERLWISQGQHIRLFGIWALLIPMASCSASMKNSSFQLIDLGFPKHVNLFPLSYSPPHLFLCQNNSCSPLKFNSSVTSRKLSKIPQSVNDNPYSSVLLWSLDEYASFS